MYFFIHADRIRFNANINHVNAVVVLGSDQYPMNLDKAYAILKDSLVPLCIFVVISLFIKFEFKSSYKKYLLILVVNIEDSGLTQPISIAVNILN